MPSFLVLCEGNTRNRWRDGQVCPDVDKELWRLGPGGSGVFWRVMRKSDEGGKRKRKVGRRGRGDPGERTDERSEEEDEKSPGERTDGEERDERRRQERRRKGLSPEIGEKKTMNAGGVANGI
ncbi:hypothetical protein TNCV_2047131 [Trichonephila clavipes]|uniref:Uncharacterized protein n=1 Tax=Trichonephila clavipes TaxID=2585209 RepID=A0A8X6VH12_TRICX|nr:hypothetical protein TNCV_2047131 [Trichonephila clavipes]